MASNTINRFTRYTAGALVAAGLALGGALGTAAVGQADPGRITHEDIRPTPRTEDRAPINTSSHLTRSAQEKARNLQRPSLPLWNLNNRAILD